MLKAKSLFEGGNTSLLSLWIWTPSYLVLFVLLLSTLVCCQPTELIWVFCFINFPILHPPPHHRTPTVLLNRTTSRILRKARPCQLPPPGPERPRLNVRGGWIWFREGGYSPSYHTQNKYGSFTLHQTLLSNSFTVCNKSLFTFFFLILPVSKLESELQSTSSELKSMKNLLSKALHG